MRNEKVGGANPKPSTLNSQPETFLLLWFYFHPWEDRHHQHQSGEYQQQVERRPFFRAFTHEATGNDDEIADAPGEVEDGEKYIRPLCPDAGDREQQDTRSSHIDIHQPWFAEVGAGCGHAANDDLLAFDITPGKETAGDQCQSCEDADELGVFHTII